MYNVGDLIVYAGEGVCRVDAVGPLSGSNYPKDKIYYTLSPLYRTGRVFIPVNTEVFMRPVISKTEAMELIAEIPEIEAQEFADRDHREVEYKYKECLKSHKCVDMVSVIKTVYLKKMNAVRNGRKLGQMDERYMKRAEDLLYGEFAVALDIPKDSVKEFIETHVDRKIEKEA